MPFDVLNYFTAFLCNDLPFSLLKGLCSARIIFAVPLVHKTREYTY